MKRFYKAVLFLLITLMAGGCGARDIDYPKASDGILDLREWDFTSHGSVELNGEWEFYWERLYAPDDFEGGKVLDGRRIMEIPMSWNGYEIDGSPIKGEGYATFRLKILMPEDGKGKSINLSAISTAHRLWVDGELVSCLGTVSTLREGSQPKYFPQVIPINSDEDVLELVLQVSNFSHRRGGIWKPITLGNSEDILKSRERQTVTDMALMGSLLIMGLYHFALYFQRKKNKAHLIRFLTIGGLPINLAALTSYPMGL